MSIYRVSGEAAYREHAPGELFEARLDPDAETRAIRRGSIELIERSTTAIQPGAFTAPEGWPFNRRSE